MAKTEVCCSKTSTIESYLQIKLGLVYLKLKLIPVVFNKDLRCFIELEAMQLNA